MSYFVYAVGLGFDTLGAREVAREPHRISTLTGSILTLRVVLGIVATALYIATVFALPRPASEAVALAILGLAIPAQAFSLEWSFHGTERMHVVATYVVGVASLQVTGYLLFVHTTDDLIRAALIQGGALLVGAVGLWIRHHTTFGPPRPRIDLAEQRRILRLALPIATSSFMIAVYYNIDKVMLGIVQNDTEVGLYEAAYKLMTATIMPCIVITQGFFPRLAAAYPPQEPEHRETTVLFARVVFLVGFPSVVLALILGPSLIELIFGDPFRGSTGPFLVLTANALMVYVNAVYAQPLLAWDQQTAFMRAVMGGAAANVGLNLLLIPAYGAVGAAIATVAAEVVVLAFVFRPHVAESGSIHGRALRQPFIALITGAIALLIARVSWSAGPWSSAALFAVTYSVTTLVLFTGARLRTVSGNEV